MRVVTILGTRPEIIRLSCIIPRLDEFCDHTIIHTGQNYDHKLNEIFFDELGVRKPDYILDSRGTFDEQFATIIVECARILREIMPDRVLILGDTNSGMSAIAAKKLGIPVYHMEAGNRCHDDRVPEEVNRKIIDASSDVLLPYTGRSRDNLILEGVPLNKIHVTGNPIYEVLEKNEQRIGNSDILSKLGLNVGDYIIVTCHRSENVDNWSRFETILSSIKSVSRIYNKKVIISTHPRMRSRLGSTEEVVSSEIQFHEPFGFFDFGSLLRNSFCALTDSGTVQEECAIKNVPCVILRDSTERPELIELGCGILSSCIEQNIINAISIVTSHQEDSASVPEEYLRSNVSSIVSKIILGYSP
ncbi:MAG TPA: UDP-N-acetylglucosamine 2-epimerase (non-hydrolyzing) [Planctomycetaceae bacterium]|nr:UDP-N-acetylglucosamine 2-epimerase (non-hydrolyzing) [Planctomycetaceae bacterium]